MGYGADGYGEGAEIKKQELFDKSYPVLHWAHKFNDVQRAQLSI